jgi:hypothetical protein
MHSNYVLAALAVERRDSLIRRARSEQLARTSCASRSLWEWITGRSGPRPGSTRRLGWNRDPARPGATSAWLTTECS